MLYNNAMQWDVPEGTIISCTGMRPDGSLFQYSSETASDLVYLEDGKVIFTVTEFMTRKFGRFPVDITLISTNSTDDEEEENIGTFCLSLYVERAASPNRKMVVATYANLLKAIRTGIFLCDIDEEGRLVIYSDDSINLSQTSMSSTIDAILEKLNSAEINADGHIVIITEDRLKLMLLMDADGKLYVITE